MKVYCLKCGNLLAEPSKEHPKGRVKCDACKAKFKYKLNEDGGITITGRTKDFPCNRSVNIMESYVEG